MKTKLLCMMLFMGMLTSVFNSCGSNDDELAKSLVNMTSGIKMYFFTNGEDKNTGELYYYINSSKSTNTHGERCALLFIAYQAGLFGKTSKFCTYLSSSNEKNAILERINENNATLRKVNCSFVFE